MLTLLLVINNFIYASEIDNEMKAAFSNVGITFPGTHTKRVRHFIKRNEHGEQGSDETIKSAERRHPVIVEVANVHDLKLVCLCTVTKKDDCF